MASETVTSSSWKGFKTSQTRISWEWPNEADYGQEVDDFSITFTSVDLYFLSFQHL